MTDLVAEAIALCEREIKEWREVIPLGVGDNENYALTQLNSWLTHKAEFEEHRVDTLFQIGTGLEGCIHCRDTDLDGAKEPSSYPCEIIVTKAKRLLGVSE